MIPSSAIEFSLSAVLGIETEGFRRFGVYLGAYQQFIGPHRCARCENVNAECCHLPIHPELLKDRAHRAVFPAIFTDTLSQQLGRASPSLVTPRYIDPDIGCCVEGGRVVVGMNASPQLLLSFAVGEVEFEITRPTA